MDIANLIYESPLKGLIMVKRLMYILLPSILFVSCNDSTGNVSDNGNKVRSFSNILVRQIDAKSARIEEEDVLQKIEDKCYQRNNGIAILTGEDSNNNGILEYAEAMETGTISILCNGRDGQIVQKADKNDKDVQALIEQKCITDGENLGGIGFYVGRDVDGDGQLSETERVGPEIVCNSKYLTINVEYTKYYSLLEMFDGKDTKRLFFPIPNITKVLKGDDEQCPNGGYKFEIIDEQKAREDFACKEDNGLNNGETCINNSDYNNSKYNLSVEPVYICNGIDGKDGDTPEIEWIEGNISLGGETDNAKCQVTGGIKVTLHGDERYICNGKDGSLSKDLNLTIKSNGDEVYIYDIKDQNKPISEPISPEFYTKTEVKKFNSDQCPSGYEKIVIYKYVDSDLDGYDDDEVISSNSFCALPTSSEIPASVTKSGIKDINSSLIGVEFLFSKLINPLTINNTTVLLQCNGVFIDAVDFNYSKSIDQEGALAFTAIYNKDDVYQDNTDMNCSFGISRFVEDIYGYDLSDTYKANLSFPDKYSNK